MNKWTKKWPEKKGLYWFYGYRYGKISCGSKNDKELLLVRAGKIANGIMLTCEGQFLFESEPEEVLFKRVTLPDLPKGE